MQYKIAQTKAVSLPNALLMYPNRPSLDLKVMANSLVMRVMGTTHRRGTLAVCIPIINQEKVSRKNLRQY